MTSSSGEKAKNLFAGLGHEETFADLGEDQTAVDGCQEADMVARTKVIQE